MLNKLIPFITQIVLIPCTLYFIGYVIIPNKEEAIVLISGLISISAILAALSFSASSAYSDTDEIKERYRKIGVEFFNATILGGVALVINYVHVYELSPYQQELFIVEYFTSLALGAAYGAGSVQIHIGIWFLQREYYKTP